MKEAYSVITKDTEAYGKNFATKCCSNNKRNKSFVPSEHAVMFRFNPTWLSSPPPRILTSRLTAMMIIFFASRGVTVKLKDGGEVHADVLVGADGIWSQVRQRTGRPSVAPRLPRVNTRG